MTRAAFQIVILTLILIGIVVLIPDNPKQHITNAVPLLFAISILGGIAILATRYNFEKNEQSITDIFLVIWIVFFLWEILASKLIFLDPFLFPAPERVFAIYQQDYLIMLTGIFQSLSIIFSGYILAILTAIPTGLIIGWRKRIFNLTYPIAKAISPVPPTVYLPYAIVLLPTFFASSVFVIFIGSFWPMLVGTIYGVHNIDRRVINSARTLGLSETHMIYRILLPAALPNIFSGALISLVLSFVMLTIAEMIGASSGLGWYIQYHSQFANYAQVIAGMILIIIVVIGVMKIFESVQSYALRWQQMGK